MNPEEEYRMDPKTGKFHPNDENAAVMSVDWPKYAIGDRFELNGVTFEITRIRLNGISMKPVIKGESATTAMTKLTR